MTHTLTLTAIAPSPTTRGTLTFDTGRFSNSNRAKATIVALDKDGWRTKTAPSP